MSSQKQIEANRRNAQRSTGPKSEVGKKRASRNALKFGLYSKTVLTPEEKDADFIRLQHVHMSYYNPRSEFERDQVFYLSVLAWRLRRYGKMEAEIMGLYGYHQAQEEDQYGGDGWGFVHDSSKARALVALSSVEDRIHRHYLAVKKQLDARLAPALFGQELPTNSINDSQAV